ncbi:MAG: pyridoxamine 5'-phosphate oxidase [Lautropia sp.]|nr:pyridoxamine 5'-phosphate oxidase [Lautropia sp.]
MSTLADLRKNYQRAELKESETPLDPDVLFQQWLDDALASGISEPSAMTLATVDAHQRPRTRIMLLKEFQPGKLIWFTNYESSKGRELAARPFASLQFHWMELERVVRIEGRVEKISEAESEAYYRSRPLGSRIGAWASAQSTVVSGREELEERYRAAEARYGDDPPKPAYWGGFQLTPDYWEFWQGRPSRLHDRLAFRLDDQGAWVRERLSP